MRHSTILALAAVTGASALALGLFPGQQTLQAAFDRSALLADTDGDGLNDRLEQRLLTSSSNPDTDGDSISDAAELLLGTDPLLLDAPPPGPEPALHLDVYSYKDALFIQVFALARAEVTGVEFFWGTENTEHWVGAAEATAFRVGYKKIPAGRPGWSIHALTLLGRTSNLARFGTAVLGVKAFVDGEPCASSASLLHVGGVFSQVRIPTGTVGGGGANLSTPPSIGNFRAQNGQSQHEPGQTQGGVFPVDPEAPLNPGGTADEVCFQILQPIASLQQARVLYQVVAAQCEAMPAAVCIPGCALTVGQTVVALDPVGLFGGS